MAEERRSRRQPFGSVRQGDIEPYTALRWVGSLFKAASVFLVVAVIAEFIAGIRLEGWAVAPILLGEIARTAVFAVVLWGGGDLVRLMIHVGHDVRADRILTARLLHRISTMLELEDGRGDARIPRMERPPEERGPEAAAD